METKGSEILGALGDQEWPLEARKCLMGGHVKAVADNVVGILNEDCEPNPKTHYGKSKLLAESYILSKKIPNNKFISINVV